MKKRLIAFLMVFFLFAALPLTAMAEGSPRLIDDAGVLDADEISMLTSILDEDSEEVQVDLVVYFTNRTDGSSVQEAADLWYENQGYGYGETHDGILLYVTFQDNSWYISSEGYGRTAMNGNRGLDQIEDDVVPELRSNDYYTAVIQFASTADALVKQARYRDEHPDEPSLSDSYWDGSSDWDDTPSEPAPLGTRIARNGVISVILGLIIGLVSTLIMKSKLKSVHTADNAAGYVVRNSLHLTRENDIFLYRTVNRRPRPKQNSGSGGHSHSDFSTHTSFSGRTHSGGGGHF